jgi:hypothetical protein
MNRGALKIIGFCVAALLLVGIVQFIRVRAENQRIARDFVDSVAHLRQAQAAQVASLQTRFDQLNLDHALDAQSLGTTDGVQRSRELLARFRALLTEREQLAADQAAAGHKLIQQLPAGSLRDGALRGEEKSTARTHQLQDQLTRAEAANADAMQAVLDWADRNHALLQVRGDKLMVNSQAALDELNRLDDGLHKSGQAVTALLQQGKALDEQNGRLLGKLQNDVRE